MLRRSRGPLVLAFSVLSVPAVAAEEGTAETPASEDAQPATSDAAATSTTSTTERASLVAPPTAVEAAPEAKHEGLLEGWRTEVHGYFRAPISLGISSRPHPTEMDRKDSNKNPIADGPSHLQLSHGPNRVLDSSYYSFAYTRLQEQDWAEFTIHQKKKHIDVAIGWMGYWLSAAGFRNPDAAGVPAIATLALDTDFEVAGITPNIALKVGAWWPSYGYFEKYDTFTLGRFRQIGEQLRLTIPVSSDLKIMIDQGIGTGRDGKFGYSVADATPLYAGQTGADLIAYGHARFAYRKYVDVGIHYNYEWTRDPYLTAQGGDATGKTYADASQAHLAVAGGEVNLSAPYAGRVWVSPSFISVKNGWALSGQGGTEVMHSQGGLGIATNYMAFNNSPLSGSTGSGSMMNLGFLYENTLSNVLAKAPGSLPDLKVSAFGLLARSKLDLPSGSAITQNRINQLKYGADAILQASTWLALMLRFDTVNYDTDHPYYIFSAVTSRLSFYTHYLSGETIFLQYSRYFYGDNMKLAARWPWNTPLVAGSDVVQGNGGYSGKKPDEHVVKLQAQVVF